VSQLSEVEINYSRSISDQNSLSPFANHIKSNIHMTRFLPTASNEISAPLFFVRATIFSTSFSSDERNEKSAPDISANSRRFGE